jgi:DNA-binding LacI/PurR family transcriptional regulator
VVIINIAEIAKLIGVSKTTVSRVINNKSEVKKETRDKILQAIEKYNYQPNIFAKAINKKETKILAIVIPYEVNHIFFNSYFEEVLRGISTQANSQGYFILLCYTHEKGFENLIEQRLVDGFILISPGTTDRYIIKLLDKNKSPFIATSKIIGEKDLTFVDVNNFYGATLAVEYLVTLGHRKIGLILNNPTLASNQDRLDGYKAVLANYALTYDDQLVKQGNNSINSGYKNMLELFKFNPTAIFVASDMMAIGAIRAIKERNLRIPDDISIIGFDDIPFVELIEPPLTTIRQPAFEKGVTATKLLLRQIQMKEKPESVILNLELIIRKSTGKCPN